jgi:putative zinc finger/helix-turn-helix YgiT family protein
MEEHVVDIVEVIEHVIFKDIEVEFPAVYEYCSNTDEYFASGDMINKNGLAVKDTYREKAGLLTSNEIISLREKYGVSQKDLSEILDWGKATITRYENHQVQDRAHDDILRKIDSDPEWFIEMLNRAKGKLDNKTFNRYVQKANEYYHNQSNHYLITSIQAVYAKFVEKDFTGNADLNLEKVVEVINYLAQKIGDLYKVKLMKLLWYSDMLNFKRYGRSITGLAYCVLPMGAVPEGHEQIMMLDGVSYETKLFDNVAYKFKPTPGFEIRLLSGSELEVIDKVISECGDLSTPQIVNRMHDEEAYKHTPSYCVIRYSLAAELSIE